MAIGERLRWALAASLIWIPFTPGASAHSFAQISGQEAAQDTELTASKVVPQQVRYAGKLAARSGESVEAVFRIYAAAEGGEPLWTETQQVSVAADGSYSVLLGGATRAGLPQTVFAGGAARWLGVTVERGEEQERVSLSSVPYAMKSADAESLAGHLAGEFVTQAQLAGLTQQMNEKAGKAEQSTTPAFQPELTPSGSGNPNTVPLWTSSSTLGNSVITESGNKIGINVAAPTSTLEVGGAMTVHGTLTFPPGVPATPAASSQSQSFSFSASAWNSTTSAPENSTYTLLAGPVGNNTATPNAVLYLNYQNGTSPVTSLFTMSGKGLLGLANPAGGISSYGNISLSPLNWATSTAASNSPLLEIGASSFSSTTNAARGQTFAWQAQAAGNDTASPTGSLALLFGENGSAPAATGFSLAANGQITFAPGQTFPGTGSGAGTITGITTASPLTGSGTSGSVALGLNETQLTSDITPALETTFNNKYAQFGAAQNLFAGPVEAFNVGGTSTYGALNGIGLNGNIGTYGTSDTTVGALGTTQTGPSGVLGNTGGVGSASNTYKAETPFQSAGVWGDTTSSTGSEYGAGVIGTADNADGGTFFNNSADYDTIYARNLGTGNGIIGNATVSGIGVEGVGGTGMYGESPTVTVSKGVAYGTGVHGVLVSPSVEGKTASTQAAGVWADTSSIDGAGLLATADGGEAGDFYNNGTAFPTVFISAPQGNAQDFILFEAAGDASGGQCNIDSGGDFTCSGLIGNVAPALDSGRQVQTYSMQAAENWFEDAGTAQLVHGVAHVDLESVFGETVNTGVEYHVFLTPDGDCKGLYVSQKSSGGFDVRELSGGRSSIAFEYRIMAKRAGFENVRLVDVTLRMQKLAEQRAKMHHPGTEEPLVHPSQRMNPPPGNPGRNVPKIRNQAPAARPAMNPVAAKAEEPKP